MMLVVADIGHFFQLSI